MLDQIVRISEQILIKGEVDEGAALAFGVIATTGLAVYGISLIVCGIKELHEIHNRHSIGLHTEHDKTNMYEQPRQGLR